MVKTCVHSTKISFAKWFRRRIIKIYFQCTGATRSIRFLANYGLEIDFIAIHSLSEIDIVKFGPKIQTESGRNSG